MTQDKIYLSVFTVVFLAVLAAILILNLALGERGLGSAEAVRQASAWQHATRGVTYAPPVTNSRPFKALRFADRLPELNMLVLGSSTVMGVTETTLPSRLRLYNMALTGNNTASIAGEAAYIADKHAVRIQWMLVGLDWSVGMIYLPGSVGAIDLAADLYLRAYTAQDIP